LFCPYCGSELKEDYAFCRNCGKRVTEEKAVAAPEAAPPLQPIIAPPPPQAPMPTLRKLRVSRRLLAIVLVSIIVVAGYAWFASTVKWIPVTRSYTERQEYKYTYKYWEKEWTPTREVIFEKRGVYLGPLSTYSVNWYQKFPSFYLGKHWEISVETSSDSTLAGAGLYQVDGTRMIAGVSGTFVTPASGDYYVSFSNFGSSSATVSAKISITAKLEVVTRTESGTATFEVTKYEVIYLTLNEWLTRKSQP